MSYDLTERSMTRMIQELHALNISKISKVEFEGGKTFARNLRQAMVAAEYIGSDEFGLLNKKWKISQMGNKVICSIKKQENFRQFKYVDSWISAIDIIDKNQDAIVISFPNLTPSIITEDMKNNILKAFPKFEMYKFTDVSGLIIRQPL